MNLPPQTVFIIYGKDNKKPTAFFNREGQNFIVKSLQELNELISNPEILSIIPYEHTYHPSKRFKISAGTNRSLEARNFVAESHLAYIDIERKEALDSYTIQPRKSISGETHTLYTKDYDLQISPDQIKLPPGSLAEVATFLRRVMRIQKRHAYLIVPSWSHVDELYSPSGRDVRLRKYHGWWWNDKAITHAEHRRGLTARLLTEQTYEVTNAMASLIVEPIHPWVDNLTGSARHVFNYPYTASLHLQVDYLLNEGSTVSSIRWANPEESIKSKALASIPMYNEKLREDIRDSRVDGRDLKLFPKGTKHHIISAYLSSFLLTQSVYSKRGKIIFDKFSDIPDDFKGNITDPWTGENDGRCWVKDRVIYNFQSGTKTPIPEALKFLNREDPQPANNKYLNLKPYYKDLKGRVSFLLAPPNRGKTYQAHLIPKGLLTSYPGGIVYLVPDYALLRSLYKDYPEDNPIYSKQECEKTHTLHRKFDDAYDTNKVNIMTYDMWAGVNINYAMDTSSMLIICDEAHDLLKLSTGEKREASLQRAAWYQSYLEKAELNNRSVLLMTATAEPSWFMIDKLQVLKISFPAVTTLHFELLPDYDKLFQPDKSCFIVKQSKPFIEEWAEMFDNLGYSTLLRYSGHYPEVEDPSAPLIRLSTSSGTAGSSYPGEHTGTLIHNNTGQNFGAIGLAQACLRVREQNEDTYNTVKIAFNHFRNTEDYYMPTIDELYNYLLKRSKGLTSPDFDVIKFFDLDPSLQATLQLGEGGDLYLEKADVRGLWIDKLEKRMREDFDLMAFYLEKFGVNAVDNFSINQELSELEVRKQDEDNLYIVGLEKRSANYKRFKICTQRVTHPAIYSDITTAQEWEDEEGHIKIGRPEKRLQKELISKDPVDCGLNKELKTQHAIQSIVNPAFRTKLILHIKATALYPLVDHYFEVGKSYSKKAILRKLDQIFPIKKPHSFEEEKTLKYLTRLLSYLYDRKSGMLTVVSLRILDDDDLYINKETPSIQQARKQT